MRVLQGGLGRLWMVACVSVAVVACGSPAPTGSNAAAQAHLMRIDELSAGMLDTLPTGSQFVRVVVFHQPPGQTIPSRKHQPGLVYVETGVQQITYGDGQSVNLGAGQASYLRSVAHSHINSAATDSAWFFLSLWPSAQRGAPLVATSQVVFETEDIPSGTLSPGSYVETLRRVALDPGGHSSLHRFGGLEVVFVLDGTLTVNVAGQGPVQLSANEGTYVAPNTTTQELATRSGTVHYLVFVVIPQGRAFETDVTPAPSS